MMANSTSLNRKFSFALVAILTLGCGAVSHAARPIRSHDSELTASDYESAERAFAGGGVMAAPAELTDGWSTRECQAMLDKRDALVAVTAGLGGLTGAGGLITIIPIGTSDAKREQMQLGIGITTVVLAAAATTFTVMAKSWSTRYEQRCMTEIPVTGAAAPEPTVDRPPVYVEVVSDEVSDGGVVD